MEVLVDTNILLRCADPAHRMHEGAVEAVRVLRRRGDRPCVAAQNLIEFRAVCTRARDANGLGMSQDQAGEEIARLKVLFHVLVDFPAILSIWERLVSSYTAVGKQNHDARIVAAMLVHEVHSVLTFNKEDFIRYPEIAVITPQDLAAGPGPSRP
jgi:predicted nucleic acid-binding protein